MNFEMLSELSVQTNDMNICEYVNFLYNKFGSDLMMSALRMQNYIISNLHSDPRILRMNYMEHNRIWRPQWSRQTRGTIFWLNDHDVWVPIKFLLERGAEVFTGFHIKNGVTETDNFKIEQIENIQSTNTRSSVLDDAQQKLIECLISNSKIPGGLVASFKKDGSLLGCTMYNDKKIEQYIRQLILKIDDKFAMQVMKFCDELNIPLLTFSTQSTLFVGDQMQDYTVTALLSMIMTDETLSQYSGKNYIDVFQQFGKSLIEKIYNLIMNISTQFGGTEDTITVSMESICKDRRASFAGAIIHKELALSYENSSLTVLGASFSNIHRLTYYPHYEFSNLIVNVCGLKEPSFWKITHTNEINSLIDSINSVITGKMTKAEFYQTYPPSNMFGFEQIIDYEGFVTYSLERNEFGSLNYNKIKTDMYYKMHKPRKEFMEFINEMALFPEVQKSYPICGITRTFYTNLDFLNKIHLKFMQVHTSTDSPLFLSLNEKAQKSFHTQQPKVQLKMLINAPIGFQKVIIGLFKEFYPFCEENVGPDVLEELGIVMKSIFMKSLDGVKLDELEKAGIIDELFVIVQKLK